MFRAKYSLTSRFSFCENLNIIELCKYRLGPGWSSCADEWLSFDGQTQAEINNILSRELYASGANMFHKYAVNLRYSWNIKTTEVEGTGVSQDEKAIKATLQKVFLALLGTPVLTSVCQTPYML